MRPRVPLLCAGILALTTFGRAQPAETPSEWRLAVHSDVASGIWPGRFQNYLLGTRLDFAVSPAVAFGAYFGYANLRGKDGRAHAPLALAQMEYVRWRRGDGAALGIPLRFATGYLAQNGPVVRAATGLAFPMGRRVTLAADILAPTLWMSRNQLHISFDVALELRFGL